MLVDTGSQVSMFTSAWVQKHAKVLKQMAILPITNVNITISITKCEKAMQQVYVNFSCNDLELEY